jgi:hypothetical protein
MYSLPEWFTPRRRVALPFTTKWLPSTCSAAPEELVDPEELEELEDEVLAPGGEPDVPSVPLLDIASDPSTPPVPPVPVVVVPGPVAPNTLPPSSRMPPSVDVVSPPAGSVKREDAVVVLQAAAAVARRKM